jgi:hypothetical protein
MPSWLVGAVLALVAASAALLVASLIAFSAGRQARARFFREFPDNDAPASSQHTQPTAQTGEHSMSGTFATAITCIDGRVQAPVADWLKINCHVTFVDMATIPGPDHALTHGHEERKGHIHEYANISVNAHGSRVVAVAGHHDCAAYPASREEHLAAIQSAVEVVARWRFAAPVCVVGLWVNDAWMVEKVADTEQGSV